VATTLYAGKMNYGNRNTDHGDRGEYAGRGSYNGKKKVNWNLFCDHCKMHGHTKNICYKLVGYPEDWKFKKKYDHAGDYRSSNAARGMNSNKGNDLANNVKVDNEDAFGSVDEGHKAKANAHDFNSVRTNLQALAMKSTYTPEQYQKILRFLDEEEKTEEMVNMACNFNDLNALLDSHRRSSYDDVLNVNNKYERFSKQGHWIVDSGATCHMAPKFENLDNICDHNKATGRRVYLHNGHTTVVTHSGSFIIPAGGVLKHVLVPEVKHNFL